MNSNPIEAGFASQLAAIKQQGLYRSRQTIERSQGVTVQCDGRILLNFCSNDYLGLANLRALFQEVKAGVERYGVGSGSAHLICGHSAPHRALEEALALFTGRQRALLFSTGYMANMGVITALTGRGDRVIEDRLNHASLLDGGLLSAARLQRYRHCNMSDLQRLLAQQSEAGKTLIVSDGVFSMGGDLAPLPELAEVAQAHNALLMIDDAHGFGLLGKNGAGSVDYFGLNEQQVPVLVGTFGKAFGTFGAFVAGSDGLIELLIQRARSYIYTTAIPPAIAEATRVGLTLLQHESWRRDQITTLVERFQRGVAALGLPVGEASSAIQPVIVGASHLAVQASEALLAQGILVSAIRPPTVPAGAAQLRITITALHKEHHIDRLLDGLAGIKTLISDDQSDDQAAAQ